VEGEKNIVVEVGEKTVAAVEGKESLLHHIEVVDYNHHIVDLEEQDNLEKDTHHVVGIVEVVLDIHLVEGSLEVGNLLADQQADNREAKDFLGQEDNRTVVVVVVVVVVEVVDRSHEYHMNQDKPFFND
jgi:hypothetical protein